MFGAEEFIKHRLPDGAVYSEIFWQQSVAGVANFEYSKMGSVWILINSLQISCDNVGPAVTFSDAYNVLFSMFEVRESSGIFDFLYLVKGSTLKITCSSNTVLFSVGYQYITKKVTEG